MNPFKYLDADVVKPSDGEKWEVAKLVADSMHDSWCQSYIHLGEIHFVSTVYCLSFRRHLSSQHPLYDFFKFHCEGTVVHISTTYKVLSQSNSSGEIYFAMGNEGFLKLSEKAYEERRYGKFSYKGMIEVIETVFPSRQNYRKSSVGECIFDYIELHIESAFN